MTDEEFIDRTQKENPDSVPQIDPQIIHNCYVLRNQFLVLRSDKTIPVGYLLHGPIHTNEPFKLDAICVPTLERHFGHGRELFEKLLVRAMLYGALELRLTCPSDLPAAQFFEHMGMLDTRQTREASGLKRLLTCWRLHIQPKPTPQEHPRSQSADQSTPKPNFSIGLHTPF